jgi:hypothetical protein
LPDQDLLLVLSEEGELALVGATADQFKELARFPAIKGKSWNHPVLVATVCWFATARRWPRSGCPSCAAEGNLRESAHVIVSLPAPVPARCMDAVRKTATCSEANKEVPTK